MKPHFAPKAKRVIFLHMAGAPSHLELFDYKPDLVKFDGKTCPESFLEGKRFAFIQGIPKLLGHQFPFAQHGKTGAWLSDRLPHFSRVVDDVCFIKSLHTDQFNHAPAQIFFNTGFSQPGRPCIGSWALYGLGAETQNLPAFVVMSTLAQRHTVPRGSMALMQYHMGQARQTARSTGCDAPAAVRHLSRMRDLAADSTPIFAAIGYVDATYERRRDSFIAEIDKGLASGPDCVVIGTAPDCDIVIEDGFMSHRHCEIRKVDGGFKLVDLGATNGVVVNDKRVKEHFLVDNDNFRLGRTEFKFKSIFG